MHRDSVKSCATEVPVIVQPIADKYLVFNLGDKHFCLEVMRVRDIIGYLNALQLPETPDYIFGIINFKGRLIPVIDLQVLLSVKRKNTPENSCIILVEIERENERLTIGLIADSVKEIINSADYAIYLSDDFNSRSEVKPVIGTISAKKREIDILDVNSLISKGTLKIAVNW